MLDWEEKEEKGEEKEKEKMTVTPWLYWKEEPIKGHDLKSIGRVLMFEERVVTLFAKHIVKVLPIHHSPITVLTSIFPAKKSDLLSALCETSSWETSSSFDWHQASAFLFPEHRMPGEVSTLWASFFH